ncbi:MAG: aldehyde dehydrogenase, partial [Rhodospirillales bacterium]|nr:aldehyde dehydrogenase [Rhodospirillales bacterium]
TPNVSVVDLVFESNKATTKEEVNQAVQAAANGDLKGVMAYNDEPLVSIDFNHNAHSSVFDSSQTQVVDGTMVRIVAWYDNEWGFSNRMSDTTQVFAAL